jgi:uncharacterized membrane protein
MSHISKTVSIKQTPAKVLDYIADVNNHPAFISALKSVSDLKAQSQKVGEGWEWTFVMAGVELKGRAETVAYTPGKLYSFKTTSGILSTFTYKVEPAPEGTRLTVDVQYDLPDSMLGKFADKTIVEGLNDQEGERAVKNLEAILGS